MNSRQLNCGFTQIPFIFEFKKNSSLNKSDFAAAERSLKKMESVSQEDRLGTNYQLKQLHLDRMFIFSIVYDYTHDLPVFASGLQVFGKNSARIFSRYFVFPEYRTHPLNHGLYNKIDNFEVLKNDLASANQFPFVFWSRDKSPSFFKKIKIVRSDLFNNWQIYPDSIELYYKDNHQRIMYLNRSDKPVDHFVSLDLRYRLDR